MQPAGLDSLNTQSLFSVIQPWLPFPIGSPANPITFACLGFPLCQIQRFLFSAIKCFEVWHWEEQGSVSSCVGPGKRADWSLKDKQQLSVWLFFFSLHHPFLLDTENPGWGCWNAVFFHAWHLPASPGPCQKKKKKSHFCHSSANALHLYWLIGHNPILVKT